MFKISLFFCLTNFSRPYDDKTPDNWIKIDSATGVLSVLADREIGCDVPRRDDLKLKVILNDGDHETEGTIRIDIVDINNKRPETDTLEMEISLYENATDGDFIAKIDVTDLDRDGKIYIDKKVKLKIILSSFRTAQHHSILY
jgi:hypothetical protein